MAITQLSVFLMNQPGALVDAVDTISGSGANIRAMSIAEANDFGILRIIVSDTDAVCKLLGEKYLISKTEVVAARHAGFAREEDHPLRHAHAHLARREVGHKDHLLAHERRRIGIRPADSAEDRALPERARVQLELEQLRGLRHRFAR